MRSRIMSSVRSKNTQPEIRVRRLLHGRGFRFRLHVDRLPGKPDIVLSKYRAVVQINGCFWHGHDCALFQWPSSRREFWVEKIRKNQKRDDENFLLLKQAGWRIATIWECAMRGAARVGDEKLADALAAWLTGPCSEISFPSTQTELR